jgi:hypothetical protein
MLMQSEAAVDYRSIARRAIQRQRAGASAIPDDFASFAAQHLWIINKAGQWQRLVLNDIQLDLVSKLTGRDLILKPRQVGTSTLMRALVFYESIRGTTSSAAMAHDSETTQKLRRMDKRFFDRLDPAFGVARSIDNASTTVYQPHASEVTIATAGSRDTGRGGTYNMVHGSEVAFWKDAGSLMAGLLQGVPAGGRIVLESTANGASGWFYDRVMNPDGWAVHFYPWWAMQEYRRPPPDGMRMTGEEQRLKAQHALDDWQIAWRRAKQAELGPLFPQEYPEDVYSAFITSGQSVFGDISQVWDISPPPPREKGRRYVAGLDFGQVNDYTVLVVLDADDLRMVDMLRVNQLSWADIRQRVGEVVRKWDATVMAEWNSIGGPNIERLREDGLPLYMFKTTAKSKAALVQRLHYALHEGGLRLQDVGPLRHELNTFVSTQTQSGEWRYEAANGGHDDCVIALGLAVWQATQYGPVQVGGV